MKRQWITVRLCHGASMSAAAEARGALDSRGNVPALLRSATRGSTRLADSEADAVILSTTLSHGHNNRLMVGSGAHGAHAVAAIGETALDSDSHVARPVSGAINTLEEDELRRVESCRRSLRVANYRTEC